MLAGIKADIVFLVNESRSQLDGPDIQAWVATLVTGDVNRDGDDLALWQNSYGLDFFELV